MLDKEFPRSIRHCLDTAQTSLRAITANPSHDSGTRPERLLGRLAAEYEYAIVDEIVEHGLHEHLDELQSKLNDVGGAIYETFFAARQEPLTQEQEQRQEDGPQ
jgi:uncharacterized alpha-E superfamily protein